MMREENNHLLLVDAHCHVDLYPAPKTFAADCAKAGIRTIAVTNAPSVFFYTEALARDIPQLIPAAGLHPELAGSHACELPALLELIKRVNVIGEVGLDYAEQDTATRKTQKEIFSAVLALSAELRNKVLTIHSRRAASETISMIGPDYPGKVILHWFSGARSDTLKALSNGYFFSVNCAMAKSETGRRILAELPPDRVLTESDGPFIDCCQNAQFGSHVFKELSRLWKEPLQAVRSKINDNFDSIFPI